MFLTCKHVLSHMDRRGQRSDFRHPFGLGHPLAGVPYISYAATRAQLFSSPVLLLSDTLAVLELRLVQFHHLCLPTPRLAAGLVDAGPLQAAWSWPKQTT